MTAYDPFISQTFEERYNILNVIGSGGMATVYGAYDKQLGRTVAIKMMKKRLEHSTRQNKLFFNESKALSLLSHPNIVQVYDTAITDSTKYIVMEYVEGITLKKHIEHRGALPEREVLYYAKQILDALDYIHSKGIVHCDIKPQNIILLPNGKIKVADFGIARLDALLDNKNRNKIKNKNTEHNHVVLGTVYYVSPEQAKGNEPEAESDLYSLGVMLYEAITNHLPFYHKNATEVARMHVNDEPEPPSNFRADISVGLEQIILRAMEKDPKIRYSNATEMLTDIRALRQNSKIIFGNENDSSRYRIVKRKPKEKVPNVDPNGFQPLTKNGEELGDAEDYFQNIPHPHGSNESRYGVHNTGANTGYTKVMTGGTRAITGGTRAITGGTRAITGGTRAITGGTRAVTGGTRAITGSTKAVHAADIAGENGRPHSHTQKASSKPLPSNTVVLDEAEIKKIRQGGKWLSVMLGVIASLVLVILLSFGIWLLISPQSEIRQGDSIGYTAEAIRETETEWNTKHTERY